MGRIPAEIVLVTAGYGRTIALRGVSLAIEAGQLCVAIGPNGAGKSTLVRLLCGALKPSAGTVRLGGDDIGSLDRRTIARRIAVVHQHVEIAFGFTVAEVVLMGRAPHQGAWMTTSDADREAVARALDLLELDRLADVPVAELSGGEQKRVAVARALAQEAPLLVLDEATAHLDIRHAVALHELVRSAVAERGLACLAISHDLTLAARYADRVLVLREGTPLACGPPDEAMTPDLLEQAFEAQLTIGTDGPTGLRYVLADPSRSRPRSPRDL